MTKQDKKMIWIAAALIIIAALIKVLSFVKGYSFSPMIGLAVFSGAVMKDKKFAFVLPLFSMFLGDLFFEVFNITAGFYGWVQLVGYSILTIITIFGFNLKKFSPLNIAAFSISSSLIFFILSNSSVWIFSNGYYAKNFSGFIDCLVAGIPFLKNGLVTDLVFSAILFGGYSLARQRSTDQKTITG
ncbi:MAG: DUF6580 family putative transport protein [Ferruginibacter sp.]